MAQGLEWEKIRKIRHKVDMGVQKTRISEDVGVCFKTVNKYGNMSKEKIQEIKGERGIGTEEKEEKEGTTEEETEEKSLREELKEKVTEEGPEEEFEFDEDLTRYEVLNQFARFRDIVLAFKETDVDYESEEKEQIIDELFKEGLIRKGKKGPVITGKGWEVISTLREKGGEEYHIVREPVEFEMEEIFPEGMLEEIEEKSEEKVKEELEFGEKAREVKEKIGTILGKDISNEKFKELLEKAFLFYMGYGQKGKKLEKKVAAAKKLKKKFSKEAKKERKKKQAVEILKLCLATERKIPEKVASRAASYL